MDWKKFGGVISLLVVILLLIVYWDGSLLSIGGLISHLFNFSIDQQSSLLLFQALLTSQITLFSIILSALFIAFQFTSERYPINFGNDLLRSRIAIITLSFLLISVLMNIVGMAFTPELEQYQSTLYTLMTILVSISVIILSYPFIQITFSRMKPLTLLDSAIGSINIHEFEKQATDSRENEMDDHPLRDIYLFIKSEIERGEITNSTHGIRQLYSISHRIWIKAIQSDEEVRKKYQTAGMFTEMFFSDYKYQFNRTGAEHYRRIVLFEPIFETFPLSLIKLAAERRSEEIVNEVISNIEMIGKKSIDYADSSMLGLSVNCLDQILVSCINNITYSEVSKESLIESVVEASNRLYWHSFEQITIRNNSTTFDADFYDKDSGTEIDYYTSPRAVTHYMLSPFYKDMIKNLYELLPSDRIAGNKQIMQMYVEQRAGYEEYIENNRELYQEFDLELKEVGTPLDRNIPLGSYSEFDDTNEFERKFNQETLIWPLKSFQMDLLWSTEGYFASTGYPNRMPPCGHLIANWTRVALLALNNPPQNQHREILRATLHLLTKIHYSIFGIIEELYDEETELKSHSSEKRNRLLKLGNQLAGIVAVIECLISHGGEDILQEILDDFKNQENEDIFEEYSSRYSDSILWRPLSDEEEQEILLEQMEFLLSGTGGARSKSDNEYEKDIIHLLNTTEEDYGKYDW